MTIRPVTKAETAKPSGAQRRTRQRAAVEEILSGRHDFRKRNRFTMTFASTANASVSRPSIGLCN